MSEPKPDNLITVHVDGVEVRVPPGTNMIEAARQVGKEVPHYCYHPHLSVVGNCRMCLVEMGMPAMDPKTRTPVLDEHGKAKVNWSPRPAIACATNATPGLQIRTDTAMVKECREGVMEFLLINHPLDCPICDQAGECQLQEFATDYGRGYSRFVEQKNVKPKRTRIGPRVMLDDERCILCSRCIRFSRDIAGDDVLGFIDRGSYSTLTCFPGKQLENNYSLNTVDICPVGALTSTDFRFKMRVWFLKQTPGICPESSVGANTVVWSREGKIHRITPRRNDAVNDTWMADSGRVLYREVESEQRLTGCAVAGKPAGAAEAVAAAAARLRSGRVALVGSGRATVEEQFVLAKVATALGGVPVELVARVGEGDGLLISADRNPNVRGALVTGLIERLPETELAGLRARIEAGEIDTILTHGEDLVAAGLPAELLAKVAVIALGSQATATTALAAVVLATLTPWEKSGSYVNQQFRLQKFAQAVPGPVGVFGDLAILTKLLTELGGSRLEPAPAAIWQAIAGERPALAGISFEGIPAEGMVLDSAPFRELPFVEGKSLHFEPAAALAAQAQPNA